ncbi:hypothetical protein ACWEOS_23455 [Micromonospora taraxaci]|uniref:hypothetical protein n=1 Tax=Micromonospora taraxaci TaxID=1316803 RepID=UPI003C2CA7E9
MRVDVAGAVAGVLEWLGRSAGATALGTVSTGAQCRQPRLVGGRTPHRRAISTTTGSCPTYASRHDL